MFVSYNNPYSNLQLEEVNYQPQNSYYIQQYGLPVNSMPPHWESTVLPSRPSENDIIKSSHLNVDAPEFVPKSTLCKQGGTESWSTENPSQNSDIATNQIKSSKHSFSENNTTDIKYSQNPDIGNQLQSENNFGRVQYREELNISRHQDQNSKRHDINGRSNQKLRNYKSEQTQFHDTDRENQEHNIKQKKESGSNVTKKIISERSWETHRRYSKDRNKQAHYVDDGYHKSNTNYQCHKETRIQNLDNIDQKDGLDLNRQKLNDYKSDSIIKNPRPKQNFPDYPKKDAKNIERDRKDENRKTVNKEHFKQGEYFENRNTEGKQNKEHSMKKNQFKVDDITHKMKYSKISYQENTSRANSRNNTQNRRSSSIKWDSRPNNHGEIKHEDCGQVEQDQERMCANVQNERPTLKQDLTRFRQANRIFNRRSYLTDNTENEGGVQNRGKHKQDNENQKNTHLLRNKENRRSNSFNDKIDNSGSKSPIKRIGNEFLDEQKSGVSNNWRNKYTKIQENDSDLEEHRFRSRQRKSNKRYKEETLSENEVVEEKKKYRDLKIERESTNESKLQIDSYKEKYTKRSINHAENILDLFNKSYEQEDEEYKEFLTKLRNNNTCESRKIKEQERDLFDLPSDWSLAHCVAEDLRMGRGIAASFKQRFQQVEDLLEQKQTAGGLAFLKQNNRYIYYLVTKKRSSQKPSYIDFWCSIKRLRNHVEENNVKQLAIPKLGCGLDKLDWSTVKQIIEFLFQNVKVEILYCKFTIDIEESTQNNNYCITINDCYEKLTDIEEKSIILYFCSVDGHVTDEMKELDEKYWFLSDFNYAKKDLGSVIQYETSHHLLCGCIVRENPSEIFSYRHFRKCIDEINTISKDNDYSGLAMNYVRDDWDNVLHQKVITMLIHYLKNVDVYVYNENSDCFFNETI